ncbi:TonB family protein [Hymenobacter koreensis]|uniref:TonB C-terminal domain-containing protein n=1 Tax=Hymenobacter koreensis TaxID=1084523 RepID=A0ABP8J6R0_9BACT
MKALLPFALSLAALGAQAQQSVLTPCIDDSMVLYLDEDLVQVPMAKAYYTQVLKPTNGAPKAPAVTLTFFPDGQLYSEVTYANNTRRVQQGPARSFYPNGLLRLSYTADDGQTDGYLRTYYPDGSPKRNDLYDHGRLIKGQYFAPDGQLVEPHVPFRQDPAFPGGNEALVAHLSNHLRYPSGALRDAAEGQVLVAFTVTARGNVDEVRVQQGINPDLDAAAVAAVRTLPAFTPGRADGERIPVTMLVPISFKAPGAVKALRRLGL